jgi:hypothetical protein
MKLQPMRFSVALRSAGLREAHAKAYILQDLCRCTRKRQVTVPFGVMCHDLPLREVPHA